MEHYLHAKHITQRAGIYGPTPWSRGNRRSDILNYFDERYTSAAVEGINNKARVITKRCYGVKTAKTLFSRRILDLNRASEAVGWGIGELRQIAAGLKAVFLGFCT